MADKNPMTAKSYKFLQEELQRLKSTERQKIARTLEEARSHGDLSENAEYDAAKQAQGMLEARIRHIESNLATAQVVEPAKLSSSKIVFGATVAIRDIDSDEERILMIVGEEEANIDKGLISYVSPLARSLIGRSVDDVVTVHLPVGKKDFEILDIRYIDPE